MSDTDPEEELEELLEDEEDEESPAPKAKAKRPPIRHGPQQAVRRGSPRVVRNVLPDLGHGFTSRFLYGTLAGALALLAGTIVRSLSPVLAARWGARVIGIPMNILAPAAFGVVSILLLAFRPFRTGKMNVAAMLGALAGAILALGILCAVRAPAVLKAVLSH